MSKKTITMTIEIDVEISGYLVDVEEYQGGVFYPSEQGYITDLDIFLTSPDGKDTIDITKFLDRANIRLIEDALWNQSQR